MKILYGVQGTGNGHITRARMLAQALGQYPVTVDYVFSGKDDNYFNMEDFGSYRVFPGLSFVARYGHIEYWNTFRRNNLARFVKDVRGINITDYDLVLNDFEPITAWAAYLRNISCLGLSHQNAFRYPQVPVKGSNVLATLVLKWFAPADQYLGFHWHHFNQPILPPMIKTDLDLAIPNPGKILVYLPFMQQDQFYSLFNLFPTFQFHQYHPVAAETRHGNVVCRPLSRENFLDDFHDCAGLICSAGFGACSEAIHYGKKLLVLPLAGQMEQASNAAALQALGYATITDKSMDFTTLLRWLDQAPAAQLRFPDVAAELAHWIVNGRQTPLEEFSRELWGSVAALNSPQARSSARTARDQAARSMFAL